MVEKAITRYNIDPSRSFLVGDRDRDIEAGEVVGVKGIKIESNEGLSSLLNFVT
jgi:D-glycero-D-manno-heptose 1,7-bisphosphate phosphatase